MKNAVEWKTREGDMVDYENYLSRQVTLVEKEEGDVLLFDANGEAITLRRKVGFCSNAR